MLRIPQVLNFRQKRRYKERQFPSFRLGMAGALIISLGLVAIVIISTWYYTILTSDLPSISIVPRLLEPPHGNLLQPTRLYDRNQAYVLLTLQDPAAEGSQYLRVSLVGQGGPNLVSRNLVNATITAFEPGFWTGPGFSLNGIPAGTHLTIAEQLVFELLFVEKPPSLIRNLQERLVAMQVTAQYGRDKVLEWYLNSAEYGEFIYGADAAARVFLGKPASQLTVAEGALLAAIAQSPLDNPWENWPETRDRQVKIIQAMQTNGLIAESEAEAALRENIQLQPRRIPESLAPEFTNLVLAQLSTELPLELIYRGGYKIITTLDYNLQNQAACATRLQLDRLGGTQELHGTDSGKPCEASTLLPELTLGGTDQLQGLEASVVVLDPQVGQILAWVGGEVQNPTPTLPAEHPAETVLSPFWYLTAFSGGMSPATLLWDLPIAHSQDLPDKDMASYHGPVRLSLAMVNDYQGAAADLVQQVGIDSIQLTVEKFGIELPPYSSSNGLSEDEIYSQPASLLDSVKAYGVLANQGVAAGQKISGQAGLNPAGILRVETVDGQIVVDWSDAQLQAIVTSQLAYLVTSVLSEPDVRGPDIASALTLEHPIAVKAGISPNEKNAWTAGYIPQLTVGVWIGASQGKLTADMAAGLWHAVMEYSTRQVPTMEFPVPDGLSWVKVCDPSGRLATPICPSVVDEVFLQGTEPVEADNLYQEFMVDRDTGQLATIFTPPDLVEKKVFLVVPPTAREWALVAGLPQPPDSYDQITSPQATVENVGFTQPQMLAYVGGKVGLYGRVTGKDFSYYRLQVGKGMNPKAWMQVGEDVHQPVQDGYLGTWDTSGLEGPYVVELLAVSTDQSLERSLLVVNVDNTAPQVEIQAPIAGSVLQVTPGEPVILQVNPKDDQALHRLEFYVDGALITTLYHSPYAAIWYAQAGEHSFRVLAYDMAGNAKASECQFTIVQ